MSAIKKSQKIFSGINFIGNFLEKPIRVGDVVINDDGQHSLWGNIDELIPGMSLDGKTVVGNKEDLKYTNESSVNVSTDISADATIASGKIELKFNAENSAFISLKEAQVTTLKLGLIDAALKQYWKNQGFDDMLKRKKYHIISEVIEAQSGTVIFSQDKDNAVTLSGKNSTPLTSSSLLADGKIAVASSSKSVLEIITETKVKPLYKAVRYRGNGNFEVVG